MFTSDIWSCFLAKITCFERVFFSRASSRYSLFARPSSGADKQQARASTSTHLIISSPFNSTVHQFGLVNAPTLSLNFNVEDDDYNVHLLPAALFPIARKVFLHKFFKVLLHKFFSRSSFFSRAHLTARPQTFRSSLPSTAISPPSAMQLPACLSTRARTSFILQPGTMSCTTAG
jgi:hypothetical protein